MLQSTGRLKMGRCALEKFEIAGLTVEFETGDGLLLKRSRPYLTSDDKKTDIKIKLDDDFFMRRRQSYPMLTLDECRYVWTGESCLNLTALCFTRRACAAAATPIFFPRAAEPGNPRTRIFGSRNFPTHIY